MKARDLLNLMLLTLLFSMTSIASAATINVGPSCSLTNAILSANNDSSTGGCAAGSGADTIIIPAGSTISLTTPYNSAAQAGLPPVTSEIIIEGNGSVIERSSTATDNFRIFSVYTNGNLTINNATIRNGRVQNAVGGGIYNSGTLVINNVNVINNIANGFGDGGGISNVGNLTVNNSIVSNNEANGAGGGIYSDKVVHITNTTISNNISHDRGGGIYVSTENNAISVIDRTTIYGNKADDPNTTYTPGQGIYSYSGNLTIINSTISSNNPTNVSNSSYGIYINGGNVNIINTTVTNNYGGIDSTQSGHINITASIIAGNIGDDCSPYIGSYITDNGNNWFGDSYCNGTAQGNPNLGPLANNGGLTMTHALLPGSGAIDGAGNCGLIIDQRGFSRPVDGNKDGTAACDIGAYEYREQPAPANVPALSDWGKILTLLIIAFAAVYFNRKRFV